MSNFFTSLFGGGNSAGGYARAQKDLVKRNTALVDALTGAYDEARRGGAFDPNAELDLLRRDNAYATGIGMGNAAAAARVAGYRPGDSAPLQAIGAIGTRARLDYDRLANGIRTQATQAGLGAADRLAGASSSILGQSLGANGLLLQDARAQDAQQGQFFGQLLNTAMPFLGPGGPFAGIFKRRGGKPLGTGTVLK